MLTYQTGLDGHIADLIGKTSPEGRSWSFDYDLVGNLTAVTDPAGTATTDPEDFTTRYTYDIFGQLRTTTDANGNRTSFDNYHPTGLPGTLTDALNGTVETSYDPRGNATSVTDQLGKTSTVSYDVFSRPLESVQPLDQDAGEFITTPAPVYDPNGNVVVSTAPNGAATSVVFDEMDRPVRTTLPENMPDGPERVQTVTYDRAGNVLEETDPKGNLTPGEPDDFVTRYAYDAANQLTTVSDAAGNQTGYAYDTVGNLVSETGRRGNTTTYTFDRNGWQVQQTDPTGATVTTEYDLDGLVTATVDQVGRAPSRLRPAGDGLGGAGAAHHRGHQGDPVRVRPGRQPGQHLALDQPGDRLQAGVRMWRHPHAGLAGHVIGAELVHEAPAADHPPRPLGEQPPDRRISPERYVVTGKHAVRFGDHGHRRVVPGPGRLPVVGAHMPTVRRVGAPAPARRSAPSVPARPTGGSARRNAARYAGPGSLRGGRRMEVFFVMLFMSITIIACAGIALGFVEGRRKYKLELHKEERRRIEARTKQLEVENKRVELEYRKALAEIEQFDRRGSDRTELASAPMLDRTDDAGRARDPR